MCCCFLKEVISAAHERAGLRPSAAQHRPHHVPTKQLSTVLSMQQDLVTITSRMFSIHVLSNVL